MKHYQDQFNDQQGYTIDYCRHNHKTGQRTTDKKDLSTQIMTRQWQTAVVMMITGRCG